MSTARQPRGSQHRTILRLPEALGEMVPTSIFLASTLLFQRSRYPAWEIGPEVCYIHHRIRVSRYDHKYIYSYKIAVSTATTAAVSTSEERRAPFPVVFVTTAFSLPNYLA